MSYTAVQTDNGIEIRDSGTVVATFDTWPPRDADGLSLLFDDANISQSQKEMFHILFGVAEVQDERSGQS